MRVGMGWLMLAIAGYVVAQDPQMNARDAFYSAADMLGVKPAKGKPETKPVKQATKRPVEIPKPQQAEAHFQQVSTQAAAAMPLGLRYAVLQKTGTGLREVAADAVFRAGDSIRLSVMANQPGYLYVIARGSSGAWTPLFPHPESTENRNQLIPGRIYEIPRGAGEYFTFDSTPGEERLFVLLSREPVRDLEPIILKLSKESPRTSLRAEAGIDDGLVERLRSQVRARDLVFTKATETAKSEGDAGVYVVNKRPEVQGDASRVMADIVLVHK